MEVTRAEIQTLYERHSHVVFGRCRTLLGNEEEAADAMQEVFIRLLKNADQFRGEASPTTWLYRVSTNLCLNRIRDRKARAAKLAHPDPSAVALPGMSAFQNVDPERRKLVETLLDKVDDETQAIVVHYYVDEMTLNEIAQVLDLSVPTLRKRIQHFQGIARRTLAISPAHTVLWMVLSASAAAAADPLTGDILGALLIKSTPGLWH